MRLRANIVLVVAVLFALAQMLASATGSSPLSRPATVLTAIAHRLPSTAIARADDNSGGDNGSSDNSDSSDNSGSDNSGSDNGSSDNSGSDNSGSDNGSSDNSGSDNSGSDNGSSDNSGSDNGSSDNGSSSDNAATSSDTNPDVVIDNVEPSPPPPASAPASAAPASTTQTQPNTAAPAAPRPNVAPAPSPQPVTEVTAVTNGTDQLLALGGDRITVQLFAAMPTGLTVTLRMVDPLAYPAVPGIRAGDLIFQIEVKDASGTLLTTLPAEVNITVHYTDMDVLGLNEANITLARLNPDLSQWETAPKLVTDPAGNTVSASITDIGVLVVYVP